VHLKPGLAPLWRGETEAQIGFDEQVATRLTLEDEREHMVLHALVADHSLAQLRGILIREHVAPQRANHIVQELTDAGVLRPPPRHGPWTSLPPAARERLAPGAETRDLLLDDGWAPIATLARSTVHVVGLGRTGARLAAALAAAGVGSLRLTDPRSVSARDWGADYGRRHLGKPRESALREQLETLPGVCVDPPSLPSSDDAVILVDYDVCDILRARDLMYRNTPHLSVVISEVTAVVGPWVTPGVGPCLRCLALHRADEDPAWPALATQLSVASATATRGEDPVLAALAGAYAAAQVVTALTGTAPPCQATTIAFELPAYTTQAVRWQPHPDCGCLGPVGAIGLGELGDLERAVGAETAANGHRLSDTGAANQPGTVEEEL
jgi:bacteriocin biosynthesis cyclodehydratase domain-containing protein